VQGSQTALANGFYGVPEAEYTRSMGAGRGRNPDSIPAFSSTQPEVLWNLLGDAMQRERTPVEARGGVVSGRIVTVLVISSVGAVIALWGVWAIMGMPT
jgi:acyl-CoA synthetase (AMP-forming)/AMP-acid ligase II